MPRTARRPRTVRTKPAETDPVEAQRPALREPMREDSRARAEARARELRDHGIGFEDSVDKYYVDPKIIPDGWDYEWKRKEVYGKGDPAYDVAVARGGWEPVPPDRHPEMMPKGWSGGSVERDGMVLMERPKVITEEAKARALADARAQMRQKEQQLRGTPDGQFQREDSKGESLVKINRTSESVALRKNVSVPIPD